MKPGVRLFSVLRMDICCATFIEHFIHKRVGHASRSTTRAGCESIDCRASGCSAGDSYRYAAAMAFRHGAIHHASYSASYVDRFAPVDAIRSPGISWRAASVEQRKDRIDAMVRARPGEATGYLRFRALRHVAISPCSGRPVLAPFTSILTWAACAVSDNLRFMVAVRKPYQSPRLCFPWLCHTTFTRTCTRRVTWP